MRTFIIYSVILFAGLNSIFFAKVQDDTDRLYEVALKEHISGTRKNIKSEKKRHDFDKDTIFIINEIGIHLPAEVGAHKIQDLGDSTKWYVDQNDEIAALKLNPIRVEAGDFKVIISEYVIRDTKSDKGLRFSYAGATSYVFHYDPGAKGYKLVRTKEISF